MSLTALLLAAAMASASGEPAVVAADFDKRFVEVLEARKIEFEKVGEDAYEIQVDGRALSIHVANIRAETASDDDPAAIDRFLDNLLSGLNGLPAWQEAAPHLFPMIDSIDLQVGPETVQQDLTDRTRLALVFHREGEGTLRFVRFSDLED